MAAAPPWWVTDKLYPYIHKREPMPDVDKLQTLYIRRGSSISGSQGLGSATTVATGWEPSPDVALTGPLRCIQRLGMRISEAPAEFTMPVKQDRRLSPAFKVRVDVTLPQQASVSLTLRAQLITQQQRDNIIKTVPEEAGGAAEDKAAKAFTEMKGMTEVKHSFDASAPGASVVSVSAVSPCAPQSGPFSAFSASQLPIVSTSTPTHPSSSPKLGQPQTLHGWPSPAASAVRLGTRLSGSHDSTMTANSANIANSDAQTLPNANSQVSVTLSHEYEFINLELLKPTRMNQVYMLFVCHIQSDVIMLLYHVPTIGICRAEQRVKACHKLGVPVKWLGPAYDVASSGSSVVVSAAATCASGGSGSLPRVNVLPTTGSGNAANGYAAPYRTLNSHSAVPAQVDMQNRAAAAAALIAGGMGGGRGVGSDSLLPRYAGTGPFLQQLPSHAERWGVGDDDAVTGNGLVVMGDGSGPVTASGTAGQSSPGVYNMQQQPQPPHQMSYPYSYQASHAQQYDSQQYDPQVSKQMPQPPTPAPTPGFPLDGPSQTRAYLNYLSSDQPTGRTPCSQGRSEQLTQSDWNSPQSGGRMPTHSNQSMVNQPQSVSQSLWSSMHSRQQLLPNDFMSQANHLTGPAVSWLQPPARNHHAHVGRVEGVNSVSHVFGGTGRYSGPGDMDSAHMSQAQPQRHQAMSLGSLGHPRLSHGAVGDACASISDLMPGGSGAGGGAAVASAATPTPKTSGSSGPLIKHLSNGEVPIRNLATGNAYSPVPYQHDGFTPVRDAAARCANRGLPTRDVNGHSNAPLSHGPPPPQYPAHLHHAQHPQHYASQQLHHPSVHHVPVAPSINVAVSDADMHASSMAALMHSPRATIKREVEEEAGGSPGGAQGHSGALKKRLSTGGDNSTVGGRGGARGASSTSRDDNSNGKMPVIQDTSFTSSMNPPLHMAYMPMGSGAGGSAPAAAGDLVHSGLVVLGGGADDGSGVGVAHPSDVSAPLGLSSSANIVSAAAQGCDTGAINTDPALPDGLMATVVMDSIGVDSVQLARAFGSISEQPLDTDQLALRMLSYGGAGGMGSAFHLDSGLLDSNDLLPLSRAMSGGAEVILCGGVLASPRPPVSWQAVRDWILDEYENAAFSRRLTCQDMQALLCQAGFPPAVHTEHVLIHEQQALEFQQQFLTTLQLLRRIANIWNTQAPCVVAGFDMDRNGALQALAGHSPGTFLCRFSMSQPGALVLSCRVPPSAGVPDNLLHAIIKIPDLYERGMDSWILDLEAATHCLDVYSGKTVDKYRIFGADLTRSMDMMPAFHRTTSGMQL